MLSKKQPWRSRIVGYGEEDPAQLLASPWQWKVHPKAQQDALSGILSEVGWVNNVVVNRTSGYVVDGHARIAIAIRRGEPTVPVTYVELTEDEEKLILLTLDPLAALAVADREQLDALLAQVQTGDQAVQAMLAELAKESGLDYGRAKDADAEPQFDRAAELQEKWQTCTGQLWRIAEHKLLVGDSTKHEDVERVMGGEKAALVVTSPPYAVGKEYEAGVSFAEHLALLRSVADRCVEVTVPGGFIFTNFGEIAPQSHAGPLTGSKRQCIYPISKDYWQIFHEERGCDLYAQRIWYKPFNRLQQPFWSYHTSIPHYQEWEHIWTWRTPGGNGDAVYDWDISVHAVWDTRNEATDDHPLTRHSAAFPVCLPGRAIKAHSGSGALIYEPFAGSGTTIVACQNLGRKCRAIEISPAYVAVCLERMAAAFPGIEVERVG